ncbi:MAG: 2-succinyl-5-enolpyruvyl-6-hydroxy-3-cyclohexene-1-carboxylic-acid synthase [Opitutales bacterium]|nr:2-succinyl-5-enolpyruvyl-6-hydroxy-3-cyclohexene-1-carboxylic-acid synthase [Opitutales bacterium]
MSSLWGEFLIRGLCSLGVSQIVISPGSRSTPLTLAAARCPELELHTLVDERSAGFFALGLAKAGGGPVALVCTSGSALAHYGPAVVEADEAGVPLLLLTADRPPELRYSRAGQTIDQLKFFVDRVRFFAEIAAPVLKRSAFHRMGSVVQDAVKAALGPVSGPVHLNIPLDEPLAPSAETGLDIDWDPLDYWIQEPALPAKGCILAGWAQPQNADAYCSSVLELARSLSWPIWADASSPLRHCADPDDLVITHYERVVRSDALADVLKPEGIILLGEPPTSKLTRQWLESVQPRAWLLENRRPAGNVMGLRQRLMNWNGAEPLSDRFKFSGRGADFLQHWQRVERTCRQGQQAFLESDTDMHEGRISWILGKHLPEATPVLIASSLAIRDAEWFWPKTDRNYRIHCNRGANGIDGLISTALGMATVEQRPAVLLCGDLAFLHDVGGLAAGRNLSNHLTIIVIQNQGGGIFEHLPVSKLGAVFENQFATPQSFSIAGLAQAFGWDYELIESPSMLEDRIARLPESGLRILEIRTDRKAEKVWRQRYLREIAIES